jgi:hypothetical protein
VTFTFYVNDTGTTLTFGESALTNDVHLAGIYTRSKTSRT